MQINSNLQQFQKPYRYFVENSIIGGNEIYKSFILQIGNFEYNDTQFLN